MLILYILRVSFNFKTVHKQSMIKTKFHLLNKRSKISVKKNRSRLEIFQTFICHDQHFVVFRARFDQKEFKKTDYKRILTDFD